MTYYRKGKLTSYLRPDAKSQVTVEYDGDGRPVRVHTIVVSTQHDEFVPALDSTREAQKKPMTKCSVRSARMWRPCSCRV